MTLLVRLAALALLALVLAAPAQAARTAAPKGLKGFLLRADEPVRHEFSRTPSFAWNPVPAALRYEFQLSTSSVFRESGLVYTDTVGAPAVSVSLTLPWITGNPYSLYARVRAVMRSTITPWSARFGFNMRWPAVPKPLPSYPGLIRWTPVEGASAYEVWFVDLGKVVPVHSNVIDEREFYTFHQGNQWIGKVRYRIRAFRWQVNAKSRANGLPAFSYGPWSPTYSSVNPPFPLGKLTPVATISDVVAKGRSTDPAHRLMPAFVYTGHQSLLGTATELYRVYVFTDRDCINAVYRGAIVGSPAYAPRPYGPLSLPRTSGALAAARGSYLSSGDEGSSWTADFVGVKTTESEAPASPTTAAAGSSSSKPDTDAPGITIEEGTSLGAPVDLWDVDWPRGGYYWTVMPVLPVQPATLTTSLAAVAASAATQIEVATASGLAVGDTIQIGPTPGETMTIVAISGTTVTIGKPLAAAHGPGEPVTRTAGSLEYRDLELAQEACAAGRVMRFGKTSEPVLTSASAAFASGLSPTGRLIAAAGKNPAFYGSPHIAWAPALGASAYELQWSKRRYPFSIEGSRMTLATSATLPLKPGTWWYRVRGINWSLPTGAQRMSWSAAAKIVVAKPRFKVIRKTGR